MSALPEPAPSRRRFIAGRRAADRWAPGADPASLEAEIVLLREENARLKLAGFHERPDLAGLLERARAVGESATDHDSATDETTDMLVEALVIRESLLEICRALERSMVAYQAKLNALLDATVQARRAAPDEEVPHRNGNGPELA
jgi:hypothetical protein